MRILLLVVALAGLVGIPQEWRSRFDVNTAGLVNTGASRYFILDPGYQLVLEDGDERLVISVLNLVDAMLATRRRTASARRKRKASRACIVRRSRSEARPMFWPGSRESPIVERCRLL